MEVEVRVPLHITGFWKPVYTEDPVTTGSLGAGVNIEPKLIVKASLSSTSKLYLNDERLLSVDSVNNVFNSVNCGLVVRGYTKAPLGAGYGLSAALALAASVAASVLCGGETLEKAALRAHVAEVKAGTGLGDVIAEFYGGFEVRVKPGPPGVGEVVHIPFNPKVKVLTVPLGRRSTRVMLSEYTSDLARLAGELVEKLIENPSLENFIEYSSLFTRRFFNYTVPDELMEGVRGRVIGYYMKKCVLTVFVDEDYSLDVEDYIRSRGFKVIRGRITQCGVEVL